jgi:DNA-binding PadR family transcriptional regulator
MYDLLILGSLMIDDKSGYKLQHILGVSLQPIRKVSNGVLNPALHKLERAQYIQATVQNDGRKTKMYHITALGQKRFFELMKQPVAFDTKREDQLRFKLKMMDSVEPAEQLAILEQYREFKLRDLATYTNALAQKKVKLEDQTLSPALVERLDTVKANHALDIKLIEVTLAWIDEQLAAVRLKKK